MKQRGLLTVLLFFALVMTAGRCLAGGESYTLGALIDTAVENGPGVKALDASLEDKRGEVLSASAYPNPELGFGAGRAESIDGADSGTEYEVSINQPIEWPGKRSSRKMAARSELRAAEHGREAYLLDLVYEVKFAFYRLLLAEKEAEIAGENLETVRELALTVRERVDAGESPGFELVKAEVEELKASSAYKRVETAVAASRARLNAVVGGVLPDEFEVEGGFPAADGYELEELVSRAVESHPIVLEKAEVVRARSHALNRERSSVVPDVTLSGTYARELDKDGYMVGLSFPLPVWNRNRGGVASASAWVAGAEAELLRTRIGLAALVREAFGEYTIARDQMEVFEGGLLAQSREALSLAEFSYREGETGLLDYLDAQRIYRDTLLDFARAGFGLAVSMADLERRAGVGKK